MISTDAARPEGFPKPFGSRGSVYLALGSNIGDRAAHLAVVRQRVQHGGWLRLTRCSSLVESAPWGPVPQPWYLNQVCEAESELPPRALMRWLLAVERLGGRERATEQRWGPRTIDLDLLAYGDAVIQTPLVTVPHPRLAERRFVLAPWAEIAPNWRHPTLGRTIAELLAATSDRGTVRWH